MPRFSRPATATLLMLALGAPALMQSTPSAPTTAAPTTTAATPIAITGAVQNPKQYLLSDLRGLPIQTVYVTYSAAGQTVKHTYTGVLLYDLLKAASPALNAAVKNDALRWAVLAKGADGYAALFSWGELDPGFGNRQVLLAYEEDQQLLPASEGAVRLVVPGDVKGGRYVSSLVELQIFRTGP